ncbi:MAG: hypothetical protein GY818_18360, partial [Planctomycetaceae bacterium]|nr:hypothetical protein [Planctomycetaceae bacterium]
MATTNPQERTHKEFRKDLERGRQTIKDMKNGLQGIKISKNGESLYKWLKAIDLDRRNHGAYVEAFERFGKYTNDTEATEILIDCNKDDLLKEAKERFDKNTDKIENAVNDPASPIHKSYALRVLVENSIDADLQSEVNLHIKPADNPTRYDGMLYLKAIMAVLHPRASERQKEAAKQLMSITKLPAETWSMFLIRANRLCGKMRLGKTLGGTVFATHMLFTQ